jgi:ATP-dependent DNA helicase RecG
MPKRDFIDAILNIPAENQTVEFKRLGGSNNEVSKIVESIVAMTNAEGGVIVLGVEDPEKSRLKGSDRIFGIEENIDHFDAIGREIQKIVPPIGSIWPPEKIEIPEIGKTVALIYIPKAVDGFRCINNHVFVRLEKSNKLLTPTEVIQFSYAKGFVTADRELVDVSFELVNTDVYSDWKKAREIEGNSVEDSLEKTGLARKDDSGILKPTRAAVLLFAEHPSDLMDTKAAIRVFQYTGTLETFGDTPNMIGMPKTIGGSIVQQISDAHEYVLTLLRTGIRIPSGFVTEYQIPERAVKEAITNAVIHRDYHLKRDIEIKIFEDRIEIESPGLLPFNITPANIGRVRASGWRNDLLVKHLREFPSPPNLDQNEGVPAMRNEMKGNNLYPPIFFTYPSLQDSLRVVLLNQKVASEWEKVSAYLEQHKYINNEEAREITGVVQRDKMTQILKNWVSQGLLIQIVPSTGYLRGTKYRLPSTRDLVKA